MDYKELIGELRNLKKFTGERMGDDNGKGALELAATAIETLLAERDAAVEEMHGRCIKCKHSSVGILDFPCTDCWCLGGANDHWKWRGLKKGDDG